jgi:ATP-dependent DNA helicase DinG
MQSLDETFGPSGQLSDYLPGFRYRAPQQRMASLVAEAISTRKHAVLEAGTGIGKTFAYLVPVLLSGSRTVVSTGTHTLQDQLFERDLPELGAALGRPVSVALLKGRNNYLCLYRLGLAIDRSGHSREVVDKLAGLAEWGAVSDVGDLTELEDMGDDYRLVSLVTSTAENCLGSRCEDFDDCFVGRARRRAQAAQVVIVNHHLLLADLALKESGFGELLPSGDVVVVDEAHLLPDIAQQFFGVSLSSREVDYLARDIEAEATLRQEKELAMRALTLRRAAQDILIGARKFTGRIPWRGVPNSFHDALIDLRGPMDILEDNLSGRSENPALDRCRERLKSMAERLRAVVDADEAAGLRWLDFTDRGFVMHFTPFDVAQLLAARIEAQGGSWVFTSATLAVGDDFDHFVRRVGIRAQVKEVLQSPFDYRSNGRIYIPDGLPDPSESDHTSTFVDELLPLIEASGGGAFVLFTSYRALNAAQERLSDRQLPGPLFVQGASPRTRLLELFRESGNGILLGTGSFWQGVDVRGPALRLVGIDKLPFAVPNDPIVQARIEAIRLAGGDAFREFQLPHAVLALKQGVGRLIRDFDDRGLVVLGDPRLRTRPYGKVFLASLPPMPMIHDSDEALAFAGELRPLNTVAEAMALGADSLLLSR